MLTELRHFDTVKVYNNCWKICFFFYYRITEIEIKNIIVVEVQQFIIVWRFNYELLFMPFIINKKKWTSTWRTSLFGLFVCDINTKETMIIYLWILAKDHHIMVGDKYIFEMLAWHIVAEVKWTVHGLLSV